MANISSGTYYEIELTESSISNPYLGCLEVLDLKPLEDSINKSFSILLSDDIYISRTE